MELVLNFLLPFLYIALCINANHQIKTENLTSYASSIKTPVFDSLLENCLSNDR